MKRSVALTGMVFTLVIGFAGASALQASGLGMPSAPNKDALLDKLAGEWEMEGTHHMGGMEIPFTGTRLFEWVCGSRYLLERGTEVAKGGAGSHEYLSLSQATGDGTYKMWFFDQMGNTLTGTGKADGSSIVWELDMEMMGAKGRSRIGLDDDGNLTDDGEIQMAGSEEWSKSRITKSKKKAAK